MTKKKAAPSAVARVYLRVSTDGQDLQRQEAIATDAKAAGCCIAGVYREKASGARAERPELMRLLDDLQPGDVVIAEKIDRISRLPLEQAEQLVATIRAKGAQLAVPGIVDLSELIAAASGASRLVLDSVQDMLLRVALQIARDDYENRREPQRQGIELAKRAGRYADVGRKAQVKTHEQIIALREAGHSIAETARLANCGTTLVKTVWGAHKQGHAPRHSQVETATTGRRKIMPSERAQMKLPELRVQAAKKPRK